MWMMPIALIFAAQSPVTATPKAKSAKVAKAKTRKTKATKTRAKKMPAKLDRGVPVAETWNLKDLYPSDAAWKKARIANAKKVKNLPKLQKSFSHSAASMRKALDTIYTVEKNLSRLYTYASLLSDQDIRDAKHLGMKQQMDVAYADYSGAVAWLSPAVLKLGNKKIHAWIKKDKGLKIYTSALEDIVRMKPHTLSPKEEKLLAGAGIMAGAPQSIYEVLSSADVKYPKIKLSNGKEVELTNAGYTKYRAIANRKDRTRVFKTFWKVYQDYARTYGVTLDANIKKDVFYAKSRAYDTALEAALDKNNVPVKVYKSLIRNAHKNLPTLHRYLKLRARMMGIKDLGYQDLYAPMVKKVELKYSYDEAKKMVIASLPLGKEYLDAAKKGMDSRWIDVDPTPGKRSGAYSNGSAYDVHPYILLNYNGSYDSVSTLAHELGHTMHSLMSNKYQPYASSDYKIFVAEVASITNEAFLMAHTLKSEKDPAARLYLLGSYLESLRTTLFRQAMFAEFELQMHEAVEKGQPLTSETLTAMYGKLLRQYYGVDKKVCSVDPLYYYEWAYIPHFYYDYYVYSYATSITAATALSRRVLNGGDKELQDYLGFLKSGSSKAPIDILKGAGVDLTTSKPFDTTIQVMNETMDEMEKILAQQAKTKVKAKGTAKRAAKRKGKR